MAPPQLSGDAPVTDIFQPVQICFSIVFRYEFQTAGLKGLYSRLRHLLHAHKPLLLYHRLYGSLAAVMGAHVVGMRHYLYKQALLIQIRYHGLSGLIAVHSEVRPRYIDRGVII